MNTIIKALYEYFKAVSYTHLRADKARHRKRKEPTRRLVGLTYKIGEVFKLEYKNGVVRIWRGG